MKTHSWIILLVCLLNLSQTFGYCQPCDNDQCSNSCSNCQQQCNNARCTNNNCRTNCCQPQQNDRCIDNTNCCQQKDCLTTSEPIVSSPPEVSAEETTSSSDHHEEHHQHEDHHHSGSLNANISSQNIVTNNNIINLTIAVNGNVVNNIDNDISENNCGNGDTSKCENNTEIVTVTVPVVVTVPVPVKVPVCSPDCENTPSSEVPPPYPPPPPPPPESGCCIIVRPCVTQNCYPYHYQCHGCRGSYGYQPINPCHGGCQRRDTWDRQSCSLGSCMSRTVDCSYCNEDFYRTYHGYSRCRGCFYEH